MSVQIVRRGTDKKTGRKDKLYGFFYGDQRIEFSKSARESTSQRMLIKVHPDCQVEACAPITASDEAVISAVKKRSRWIYQQLQQFSK